MSQDLPSFAVPEDLPDSLPLMALRKGVLLPGSVTTFRVGRARSVAALDATEALLLVASQREPVADPSPADLLSTATLARVLERRPGADHQTAVVQGLARVTLTGFVANRPCFKATFARIEDRWPDSPEGDAMARVFREEVEQTAEEVGLSGQVSGLLNRMTEPALLVDGVAALLPAPDDWKRGVLHTHDPLVRADRVLERLVRAREVHGARKSIKDRLESNAKEMRKEALLRQQLDAIRKELGDEGSDELDRLRARLDERDLPDEVRRVVDRELRRLERLAETSPERSVTLDWLEWIADLPWNVTSSVEIDLGALEVALDGTHYGLEDVKKQVIQHLSVRKLAGSGRADVLLLVGPPGTGKTSIGQAIAEATGRKLVRVALGGVRDEAELRGHRRTYIGARPGRLVEGIRRAGTADGVVLLDEVDKLSLSLLGNPAAALLEILDPEQNHAFVDHYLEVPFDLSRMLFVATANDLSTIPAPLRDRMEVIQLHGYTRREKLVIAREHLVPTVARNAGVEPADVHLDDEVLAEIVAGWTQEAGVRELQRMLGKIFRAVAVFRAKGELDAPLEVGVGDLPEHLGPRRFFDESHEGHDRAGVATGLAWTPVGGGVLYVEASTLPGKGQLLLTGQLGDVMKESARAALTYVLAHGEQLGIDPGVVEGSDVHVHVPAGAVPKDGPSAGVTIFAALASLLSGRPVRDDTAMTGEATLRGRVLPVGGIKAKVLAAHRRGIRRVILPIRNQVDLEEVPEEVRAELEFIPVRGMSEALEHALEPPPTPAELDYDPALEPPPTLGELAA